MVRARPRRRHATSPGPDRSARVWARCGRRVARAPGRLDSPAAGWWPDDSLRRPPVEDTAERARQGPEVTCPVESADCCVVGAGPAGAVLALLLARQGVSV